MADLTNFSFEFYNGIFAEDASPLCLYRDAKSQKWPKTQIKGSWQDSLEAILVIFGRNFLNYFFCLKGLAKIWKTTPLLCACAVFTTLETQKCQKRHLASSDLTLNNESQETKTAFTEWKRNGRSTKNCLKILNFSWGLSYDLSKFSDDFTPFFRFWKTILLLN